MAPVSMFILSHIADWNKGAAQFINVGLAVADVLFRGDPTSLLLNLTGMAFAEFNEMSRKTIANRTPDSWNGRRFGYVRRGDTYVPAILREVEENTGFGQRGRTMKMQFADEGGELRWTFGGDGKLEPIFTNYLEESFCFIITYIC